MKKINKNLLLRFVYGGVSIILLIMAISIPQLISQDQDISNFTIAKEVAQEIIIAALAACIWLAAKFYQRNLGQLKKIKKLQDNKGQLEASLSEAVKHIGSVNVQLETIKSTLSSLKDYPTSKEEFRSILKYFTERILTIAKADWVVVRILDLDKLRTLREHTETRNSQVLMRPTIDNKHLVNSKFPDYQILTSEQNNLAIKIFVAMPKTELKDEQVLIKAILNQLEMLFIIFTSKYYRDNCLKK
ncbi:hypothetical protein COT94_03670 [Candidatus Falkowbacteria bacterium CG10_big_fil_rev_8_21_14_0_10_37_14]|uniref:Uncharacterized protein n=1 Tax=Candidatus Falkowbacteria bacterium CG10_big_fil_rev_8_21_14_0_10_37_14 TaxID=1974561 RepID=A0A2M6WSQ9_9BACT|nr:hypothetical protein [Candidatus Falkowbacteria bacterium]PIT95830.1 MAG: hypothetical protein COT94_03670 [Candidatus Falkowbacteria bacterium CG10_big_fil_rev_8_21_14_0_10_37_14]